jgi:hypothetical protein
MQFKVRKHRGHSGESEGVLIKIVLSFQEMFCGKSYDNTLWHQFYLVELFSMLVGFFFFFWNVKDD